MLFAAASLTSVLLLAGCTTKYEGDIVSFEGNADIKITTGDESEEVEEETPEADVEENNYALMEKGMRAKFAQNSAAAEMLKKTGDAVLIKSCAVCYKCGFGEGSGENRLGKMLMKIREELSAM